MTVAELHRAGRSALAQQLHVALRLDRTQSDPLVAARNTVGVIGPLVVGALAGNAAYGLLSCIGALQTAFSDRPGPYRLRLLRMSTCALAVAVVAGLAVVCSASTAASIGLLFGLAFLSGLLLAAGPSAAQLGIAGTGSALVIGHSAQSPSAAIHIGLLVLAGGAVQVVLAVAAWPLGRHAPERQALAGLYLDLAAVARRPPGTADPMPASDQLTSVRQVLFGLGHDHGPSTEAYRVLMDEAERIRRGLVVLSAQAERLDREGESGGAAAVRAVLLESGLVLDSVADSLTRARVVSELVLAPVRDRVEAALTRLDRSGTGTAELTRRAAAARAAALLGQLRAAVETSRVAATEGVAADRPARRPTPLAERVGAVRTVVRAYLTPDSALLRHAVRLAVLVAGTDLIVRLAGVGHGYWVSLTILVVLRPDFGTTFQRGLLRALGTILGLLLATGLIHFVTGGQWWLVGLSAACFYGMRLAGPGNVGLSAVGLSAFVVVLLALDGVPVHTTVAARSLDTALGAGLALGATLLWPVWERQVLPSRLGDLLEAYRHYLAAVLDPAADSGQIQQTRAACRLARGNARASVDRARAEPAPARGEVELGEAVLVHTHRFVNAMLVIDDLRRTLRENTRLPRIEELLRQAGAVLVRCEQSVRSGQAPRNVAALRPAQEEIARVLAEDPTRLGDAQTAGAVLDATDRIANSLDTLVSELRRQLPAPPGR